MDERIKTLAHLLVTYSTKIRPSERVLVDFEGRDTLPLIKRLIKEIYAAGGVPFVTQRDSSLSREILLDANEKQLQDMADWQMSR